MALVLHRREYVFAELARCQVTRVVMNGLDQGGGGAPGAIKMQFPAHVTSRYQFSRHCENVNWLLEGAPPEKRSWPSGNSSTSSRSLFSLHHRFTIKAAVKRGIFPFTYERVNFVCWVVFASLPISHSRHRLSFAPSSLLHLRPALVRTDRDSSTTSSLPSAAPNLQLLCLLKGNTLCCFCQDSPSFPFSQRFRWPS